MQELSSCYKVDTSSPYILGKFVHFGPFILHVLRLLEKTARFRLAPRRSPLRDRLSHDENCISGASLTLKMLFASPG